MKGARQLATALNSLITMVTGAWGTIVAWTPILIAAAFAVIGFCISGISKKPYCP